ncbi:MAG: RDD family protein [Rhodoglobus sp.]
MDTPTPPAQHAAYHPSLVTPVAPVQRDTTGPYRFASFGRRLSAFLIDAVALFIVFYIGVGAGIAINGSGSGESGIVFGVLCATLALYYIAMTCIVGITGRSIGKLLLGLRVVNAKTLQQPGLPAAALRCLLLALSIFGIVMLALLITALMPEATTGVPRPLHDRLARTVELNVRLGADPARQVSVTGTRSAVAS